MNLNECVASYIRIIYNFDKALTKEEVTSVHMRPEDMLYQLGAI